MSDRTAEIWSTRLQRELLSLAASMEENNTQNDVVEEEMASAATTTAENKKINNNNSSKESSSSSPVTTNTTTAADTSNVEGAKSRKNNDDDGSEITVKHGNVNIPTLPSFVKVQDYEMDITRGICTVTFAVEVQQENNNKLNCRYSTSTSNDCENVASCEQNDGGDDDDEKDRDKEEKEAVKIDGNEENINKDLTTTADPVFIFFTLDASMNSDSNNNHTNLFCYPFQMPKAILAKGAELFPVKSSIDNGDYIDLDCDWTPSLHLSDAALNIALKIRESVRRQDPFFPAMKQDNGGSGSDTQKATRQGSEFDANLVAVASMLTGGASFLPGMTKKKDGTTSASSPSSQQQKGAQSATSTPAKKSKRRTSKPISQVQIGDLIDLSEPPYSVCVGMFSCKAIRRPAFVEQAIVDAAVRNNLLYDGKEDHEDENYSAAGPGNYMRLQAGGIRKVAGAGLAGAGMFFKSMAQSAKAALEESYLMITQDHVMELRSSKFSLDSATITFISPISLLAKLKFRRDESISLFFKQASEDPLILMCPDSAHAVQQIQSVLKRHGVKGKHTNAATQRQIQTALQLVIQIQSKENTLEKEPTVERVNEIMDLYRQAAEKFEISGDARHEEVMTHMRQFLEKPLTQKILEEGYRPPPATIVSVPPAVEKNSQAGKEEKLVVDKEKESGTPSSTNNKIADHGYEDTMKQADDILSEVGKLGIDDDLDDFLSSTDDDTIGRRNAGRSSGKLDDDDDDHDPVAELDAMLSAADKELNDIIDS